MNLKTGMLLKVLINLLIQKVQHILNTLANDSLVIGDRIHSTGLVSPGQSTVLKEDRKLHTLSQENVNGSTMVLK